jgi:hypothetical protein
MTSRSARGLLAGRGFMLFPAAAFAVHQLRYELGYGSRSGAALSAQGHGYQNSLAPWVVLLLALGLGSFLARLARAAGGRADLGSRRSFAGLFLVSWGLLLATYGVQEWLEGVFAVGHPSGLAGVFGHGGWWAIPLSGAAAAVVAALLRLAAAAVDVVARLASARPLVSPPFLGLCPPAVVPVRTSPLARRSAGRAPPAARSL